MPKLRISIIVRLISIILIGYSGLRLLVIV